MVWASVFTDKYFVRIPFFYEKYFFFFFFYIFYKYLLTKNVHIILSKICNCKKYVLTQLFKKLGAMYIVTSHRMVYAVAAGLLLVVGGVVVQVRDETDRVWSEAFFICKTKRLFYWINIYVNIKQDLAMTLMVCRLQYVAFFANINCMGIIYSSFNISTFHLSTLMIN